ncbi:ATP-binding cassette domain-containing protein [Synechococcus sp. RSCCF101]|uniref:phosphonate ABC transporter ATP-binding protein n=1 Tax=Synechococcus sp. RSCCF101 TaxID=2511069 RepID=UPI0012454BB6|nr:ATP-binding cassette domain-containing protein [Synechococcus sp. RSCCF101]QEY31835.1 ATP-binding cassette domain-containing protein [Synechococcus sp. RSCCF101]
MSPVLELKAVGLAGRGQPRLDGISLTLQAGERVALIGASGAGKSSLLAVANGSLQPTRGVVRWFGEPAPRSRRRRRLQQRRIGTLWQDLRLVEALTVQQNLNCGCLGRWSPWRAVANLLGPVDTAAGREVLRRLDLDEGLLPLPVQRLSGGQRQRVAIGRLLRQQAELLLVDEPLAALDPPRARSVLALLMDLAGDGATLLLSLHRPDWLGGFDRVIGLEGGRCVLDADPASLAPAALERFYEAGVGEPAETA